MRFQLLRGLLICSLTACTSNTFKAVDKADPAEAALAALDAHKSDEAIEILEKAIAKSPEDWILVSLMASAKAQKSGIDTTDIALKMADDSGDADDGSGNALTALFTVLPTPTAAVIALLAESTALLASIPDDAIVEGDLFKISLFNTALTALQAKYFDVDGNGQFSIDELLNLDEEAALNILNSLLNAENAATTYKTSGGTAGAASSVSQIRTKIDAQAGDTQAEKLKNFLGSSGT